MSAADRLISTGLLTILALVVLGWAVRQAIAELRYARDYAREFDIPELRGALDTVCERLDTFAAALAREARR